MIRIGVIGFGYWGPNIVRNFNAVENAAVVAVCDKNKDALSRLSLSNPGITLTTNADEIINSGYIDMIAVVTPVSTHYDIARRALEHGKHVFIEKPFTNTSEQAIELIDLAETKKCKILVDHTFIFTGAVRKIKQLIVRGDMGNVYYYDSVRVNLGLFQHDVNVVWDLAPHDFSLMSYLIDEPPVAVSAWGQSHVGSLEDIAYINVHFNTNIVAHFSVNWLSPVKVRTTLIGCEKRMLVWNDLNADEKVRIYDKGVDINGKQGIYDLLVSYRSGDMWAPKIEQNEALFMECSH
ncbi:MAG: Gfo/Idh/MocA family oxidoreductase, partial [Fibrobacter sp.]|nr:Gfo/Idh/MocA family oxidoreductase [Fibrobacter sp.]